MCTCGTERATASSNWPSRWVLHPYQWMQWRCLPKLPPTHAILPYKTGHNHIAHHMHHQDPPPGPICETHAMGTPHGPCWINAEDMTLEATLHNISINPSSIDGPADGEIFESNHLTEIADIQSKLIWNVAKVGKTYHHLCAQLLNPSLEELENFLVNCERDFDSHLPPYPTLRWATGKGC